MRCESQPSAICPVFSPLSKILPHFSVQSVFVLKTICSMYTGLRWDCFLHFFHPFDLCNTKRGCYYCSFSVLSLVFLHGCLLNYGVTGPRWDCFLQFFKPFNICNTNRGWYYRYFFVLSMFFLHVCLSNYEVTMHVQRTHCHYFCLFSDLSSWLLVELWSDHACATYPLVPRRHERLGQYFPCPGILVLKDGWEDGGNRRIVVVVSLLIIRNEQFLFSVMPALWRKESLYICS